MAKRVLHSPDSLRQLLRYDPEAGKVFWRRRSENDFPEGKTTREHRRKLFNSRFENQEAFTSRNDFGHAVTSVQGIRYKAHRVIWAMVYDKWPKGEIDHINGVADDNRLCNLRDVSHKGNLRNQKLRSSNTSGVNGVSWAKREGKWKAHVTVDGKTRYLGMHDSIEAAASARAKADSLYGFHENHGASR